MFIWLPWLKRQCVSPEMSVGLREQQCIIWHGVTCCVYIYALCVCMCVHMIVCVCFCVHVCVLSTWTTCNGVGTEAYTHFKMLDGEFESEAGRGRGLSAPPPPPPPPPPPCVLKTYVWGTCIYITHVPWCHAHLVTPTHPCVQDNASPSTGRRGSKRSKMATRLLSLDAFRG